MSKLWFMNWVHKSADESWMNTLGTEYESLWLSYPLKIPQLKPLPCDGIRQWVLREVAGSWGRSPRAGFSVLPRENAAGGRSAEGLPVNQKAGLAEPSLLMFDLRFPNVKNSET